MVTHHEAHAMGRLERFREATDGQINLEQFKRRAEAGWRLVAFEWERELPEGEFPAAAPDEEVPYGVRVSQDCLRLEVDPAEQRVLVLMMDLIAQDFPLSHIASDLNEKGFRTRAGRPWTQISVFEMLPRLIDVGPRLFHSQEWSAQRAKR